MELSRLRNDRAVKAEPRARRQSAADPLCNPLPASGRTAEFDLEQYASAPAGDDQPAGDEVDYPLLAGLCR
jgi:hypothetical protein